ncbi:MAG: DNA gyrase/topoisomerase IV subunit A [Nannocystaceae bacterium]
MRSSFLGYAMSVIISRALPDVRDGLKPVHRRILYAMHQLKNTHTQAYKKSARIVGDVIGKYHPHGDSAVYDALVRLAQDFAMRYPLVDGQGNFGSIDGDSPAAHRYTEAKLTKLAAELLVELRKQTVAYRDTYDGTGREPVVLPARFPQLLVNGSTGIAVGMATSVPPHNLEEVCKAASALIDKPDLSVRQLMRYVKGPDFPTGGQLVADKAVLARLYEKGKGSCKLQGAWKVKPAPASAKTKSKSTFVVIHEVPYGVEKSALVEEIGNIILGKKLPGLVGVQDLSTEDVHVELELRGKGSDPALVMAYLLKHTRLQVSIKFDLTCLIPTDNPEVCAPARLDLAAILRHFVDFRILCVRRRFEFELRKLEERIHILEGFEIIFDDLDRAIRIIRRSEGKADAAKKLIKAFAIDEIQAEAILETKLYRLAKLEINRIREELAEKRKLAKKIRGILKSPAKLRAVVKSELDELATTYRDRRRTKIGAEDVTVDFTAESFIVEEDAVVLVTRDGWVKRGRKINLKTTRMREGDEPLALIGGSTRECLVLFSNKGSAYTLRINDIPPSTGHGIPVQKLLKFKDGERVIGAIGTDVRVMPEFAYEKPELGDDYEDPYPHMLAVTRGGLSLRFTLWGYRDISTARGRKFGRLKEGDEFLSVFKVYAEDNVYALTQKGRMLACNAQDIKLLSGAGRGVTLMKVGPGDQILAAHRTSESIHYEKKSGSSKKLVAKNYAVVGRGGKGTALFQRGMIKRIVGPEIPIPTLDEDAGKGKGK